MSGRSLFLFIPMKSMLKNKTLVKCLITGLYYQLFFVVVVRFVLERSIQICNKIVRIIGGAPHFLGPPDAAHAHRQFYKNGQYADVTCSWFPPPTRCLCACIHSSNRWGDRVESPMTL